MGPDGHEVPSQLEDGKVLFVAKAPSVGYSVYDVRRATAAAESAELKVTESSLENARYRVTLNGDGDVSSIFDKTLNKELLAGPIRMAFSHDQPRHLSRVEHGVRAGAGCAAGLPGRAGEDSYRREWPGAGCIGSRARVRDRVHADCPAFGGDAGDHVEFSDAIDWKTLDANLKVGVSVFGEQRDGDVQLGGRHDRAAHGVGAAV